MSPCRAILTLYVLSLAVGCLVGLALANRWLAALDDERRRAREEREETHEEMVKRLLGPNYLSRQQQQSLTAESDWLIRDTAEKGLVFERDAGATAWSQN